MSASDKQALARKAFAAKLKDADQALDDAAALLVGTGLPFRPMSDLLAAARIGVERVRTDTALWQPLHLDARSGGDRA